MRMILKDLHNKTILVHNHQQKMNILNYMELNGVRWASGSLPTQYDHHLNNYPLIIEYSGGSLKYMMNFTYPPILTIDYLNIESKLNWYKVLKSIHGVVILHHIITNLSLHLNDSGYIDNVFMGRYGFNTIDGDYTLSSSDRIKLYNIGSDLFIRYNDRSKIINITDGGFKSIDDIPNGAIEIEKVEFKKI